MTITDEPTAASAAPPRQPVDGGVLPRLADGMDLIGEYEGSGFKEPPSLVRRADGQVIQLTPLLYSVAEKADGTRTYEQIAEAVSREIGRQVTADNVEFLVDEKLRPLGVLTAADGSSPKARKLDPLLGLKFRAAVIPEWLSRALAAVFRPLFLPPVIAAALAGLIAADVWLFAHHGVAQAIRQSMYDPGIFLVMFAMVVLSAAYHEIGHATACRYGGANPGRMGCGLYLAWPAFYTDVTDAYRLGKKGRLRTDLGGVYFNTIFILMTVGAYFATHFEPLLLLVVVEHFEIVHQLLPIVRLDGYYIVADLTGVPDLFTRIKPILVSMVPGKKPDERVTVLKRWVRIAVTAWVLVVVPLLGLQLLMVLIHLPRILGTAWDSAVKQGHAVSAAFGAGKVVSAISGIVQLVALALPILGILLMLFRLAQRGASWTWGRTDGRPVLRVLTIAGAGAVAVLLALAWVPKDNYTPIRRGERGTLAEGVTAVRRLPTGRAPLVSERRAMRRDPKTTNSTARTTGHPSDTTATTVGTTDQGVQQSSSDTPTTAEAPTTTEVTRSAASTSGRSSATSTTVRSSTTSTSEPSTTTTTEPTTSTTSPDTTSTAPSGTTATSTP